MPRAGANVEIRVEGDHFAVDAQARFPIFVSYYDGLRASDANLPSGQYTIVAYPWSTVLGDFNFNAAFVRHITVM